MVCPAVCVCGCACACAPQVDFGPFRSRKPVPRSVCVPDAEFCMGRAGRAGVCCLNAFWTFMLTRALASFAAGMLVVTARATVCTVILLLSAPCKGKYIVDVGFNVGQDTAMYLEAGYHVAAVEANPRLVEWARRTEPFSIAVASGRLTLLNRVVTAYATERNTTAMGNVTFFMSSHTERSKRGACYSPPCTAVNVETSTCDTFVHDFRPEYIKIDAEGADLMCIEAILRKVQLGNIPAPKYISIEAKLTPSLFVAAQRAAWLQGLQILGSEKEPRRSHAWRWNGRIWRVCF